MTKRISDESGSDAGVRNIGRLALSLIPWALGLATAVWCGVYLGVHDIRHQLSQEDRAAVYTGAGTRPTSKIIVTIVPHDCTHITRADIDGETLLLYARNDCEFETLDYLAWHWQLISPNKMILREGYTNNALCPIPAMKGDIAECHLDIATDDRASVLKVWTSKDTR